jgi:hypothetical protein
MPVRAVTCHAQTYYQWEAGCNSGSLDVFSGTCGNNNNMHNMSQRVALQAGSPAPIARGDISRFDVGRADHGGAAAARAPGDPHRPEKKAPMMNYCIPASVKKWDLELTDSQDKPLGKGLHVSFARICTGSLLPLSGVPSAGCQVRNLALRRGTSKPGSASAQRRARTGTGSRCCGTCS